MAFSGRTPEGDAPSEGGSILRLAVLIGLLAVTLGGGLMVWTVFKFPQITDTGEFKRPLGELLIHLSVAAIVFGVFNIMIEVPDWGRYFEKRLQRIVLEHGYLKSLGKEQQRLLWRRVIRAMFDNQDIDRTGTFADYFDRHLLEDLAKPYRENVRAVLSYEGQGEDFFVHDSLSYVVRSNRGSIQDSVPWENDENEVDSVKVVRVGVRFPDGHPRAGQVDLLLDKQATSKEPLPRRVVVRCSLSAYADVDGLIVELESQYVVKKSRFQYWEMSTSTRDFSLTINHDPSCAIVFKAFVHDPELTRIERLPNQFRFECGSWMLVNSGVAWRLQPQDPPLSLIDYIAKHPSVVAIPPIPEEPARHVLIRFWRRLVRCCLAVKAALRDTSV